MALRQANSHGAFLSLQANGLPHKVPSVFSKRVNPNPEVYAPIPQPSNPAHRL